MAHYKQWENKFCVEISEIVKRNLRPKKKYVIAERTKFMPIKQKQDESMIQYLHRLREAGSFCDFEKLETQDLTIEDSVTVD